MQNPFLRQRKFRSVQRRSWNKVLWKTTHDILASLPDLIAESAICVHHLDVEVKISASGDIGKQSESKSISSALRNAVRESRLLILGSPCDLVIFKIARQELVMQRLKLDTADDV